MDNQIQFGKFGVMIDCSRNAVMSVDALKKFITLITKMGYNQVHLYMEDTYEVDGEDYFGYLRGKYSKEELKELDDFAFGIGVELVPNIQTLAHMTAFVRWRSDIVDTNDILLVGDERVYDLIDRMFSSLRQCFRTNLLHIGMDEAHMLGRGKYYDLNGPQNRFDILLSHLQKVCALAEKYQFQPMMWSDMFYRLANGGEYYESKSKFDASIKAMIPSNLTLVYWDYYHDTKTHYNAMINGHSQLSDKLIFAGGAWKWRGFAPLNSVGIKATKAAIPACQEGGLKDVFLTMWGDDGGECSSYAVLPTLCYGACLAQGITKMADIRAKFQEWTGLRYDDFMLLDAPNLVSEPNTRKSWAKTYLFADCFMSIFQQDEKPEYAQSYASIARKLKNAAARAGEYSYIFDTLSKLSAVLAIKVNICTRTREAYASGDKQQLDAVIRDYRKMIKRTEDFYQAFRKQWYTENKPHGFDVQDIRIGGLLQRMRSCLDRLELYRDGAIDSIAELEEEILPMDPNRWLWAHWGRTASNNIIYMI